MSNELCFVLMPFGRKQVAAGSWIDFDRVYHDLVAPAIRFAGLDAIRAKQEGEPGGADHRPMSEGLVLCHVALVDLTAAGAREFYKLGVRHALRPHSTVLLAAAGGPLPLDVEGFRCIAYRFGADGTLQDLEGTREAIADALQVALSAVTDRAAFRPARDLSEPHLDPSGTYPLREKAGDRHDMAQRLAKARTRDGGALEALRALEAELGDISDAEVGVVFDLFLSYRAIEAWKDMIRLKVLMSRPLQESVVVQQQFALALNRDGRGEDAEPLLLQLIARRGPSGETYGILGRIYKDRWNAAFQAGKATQADGFLDEAIDAYLKGFQVDWRDAYPGINALTLMEIRDPHDHRSREILPVVKYAVTRRITSGHANYWDHATLLELAVLGGDEAAAADAAVATLTAVREVWEPDTTALNLSLIREVRARRA